MRTYKIAAVPLDGVGKEVIPLGVKAMELAGEITGGFGLEVQYYEAGVEYAQRTGRAAPEGFRGEMEAADAMFCGSAGHYDLEMAGTDYAAFAIGSPLANWFRREMGNNIGLRPLRLLPGVECPLKNRNEIDVYLVRSLAEGNYLTPGRVVSGDAAFDTQVVTRRATEELAHYAFRLAGSRNGRRRDGRKLVTLGGKHGIIACMDFYRMIFTEVADQYPEVQLQFTQIDALAEHLLKDPDRFDVIVCENMHGDIIGDIGAFITGGMGITPTADVGGVTPHFRPNHGTFPRAVGKGIANPLAAILTGALLLETLAMDHGDPALGEGASLLRRAVVGNLQSGGPRTADMGGAAGTEQAAAAVFEQMETIGR